MAVGNEIQRLVKKYGLQYGGLDDFSGVSVRHESCWRLQCDLKPDGVLVSSPREAEHILQCWTEQLRAQRAKKVTDRISYEIDRGAQRLDNVPGGRDP